jgi:hypothetical protein
MPKKEREKNERPFLKKRGPLYNYLDPFSAVLVISLGCVHFAHICFEARMRTKMISTFFFCFSTLKKVVGIESWRAFF